MADLKQKVLNFLGAPNGNKNAIKIIDVEYAIICAMQPPPSNDVLPPDFPNTNTPSVITKIKRDQPINWNGNASSGYEYDFKIAILVIIRCDIFT